MRKHSSNILLAFSLACGLITTGCHHHIGDETEPSQNTQILYVMFNNSILGIKKAPVDASNMRFSAKVLVKKSPNNQQIKWVIGTCADFITRTDEQMVKAVVTALNKNAGPLNTTGLETTMDEVSALRERCAVNSVQKDKIRHGSYVTSEQAISPAARP